VAAEDLIFFVTVADAIEEYRQDHRGDTQRLKQTTVFQSIKHSIMMIYAEQLTA